MGSKVMLKWKLMKKILIVSITVLLLNACNSRYEYVEIAEKTNFFGGKEAVEKKKEVIYSKNDTLAYMEEIGRAHV